MPQAVGRHPVPAVHQLPGVEPVTPRAVMEAQGWPPPQRPGARMQKGPELVESNALGCEPKPRHSLHQLRGPAGYPDLSDGWAV